MRTKFLGVIILLAALTSCKSEVTEESSDISIYFNGDIITMETENPNYVEAIAEKDGKIFAIGPLEEMKEDFKKAKMIDLDGATLLPGL